jgi:hypothetical protein
MRVPYGAIQTVVLTDWTQLVSYGCRQVVVVVKKKKKEEEEKEE